MGQRLNLEITSNGDAIANAYYHWSAYTGSTIMLTKQVLEYLAASTETDPLSKAIKALESTGAKVTKEEFDVLKEKGFDVSTFEEATDRSDGLISITEDGINQTRTWEEGHSIINMDSMTAEIDVFYEMSVKEFDEQQVEEEEDDLSSTLATAEVDFNFDQLTLEDLLEFDKLSEAADKSGQYAFNTKNDTVIQIIA